MKTVHQPLLLASSSGRNDVTKVPKIGTIHRTQMRMRKILVAQPALAGLASPCPPPAAFLRWPAVGVAAAAVVAVSVMRWPPQP